MIKAREVAPLSDWSLSFLIRMTLTLLGGALHLRTVLQMFRLGGGVVLSAAAFVLPVISELAVFLCEEVIGRKRGSHVVYVPHQVPHDGIAQEREWAKE